MRKTQEVQGYNIEKKPIIDILLGDYENDIYVKIMNNGVGPAIIDKLICEYEGTMELSERRTFALIKLLKDSKATSSVIVGFKEAEWQQALKR